MQWKGISKVFYEKVIVHLIGIIVFVFGVISLVSSFVTSDEKKKYAISITSILLNRLNNLVKDSNPINSWVWYYPLMGKRSDLS